MLERPAPPPSAPVALRPVDRTHRAVLQQLSQLYRHDLSGPYGLLPNADGTFNDRRLDLFLAGARPDVRAWLIEVAGGLGGYVMTRADDDGPGRMICDFFVVRALRRTGVGREVARQVILGSPGPWRIGFQRYNAGALEFWSRVATDAAGDAWEVYDDPPPEDRPPDTWIRFDTTR
ncbi:MAG TPA: GNAT family N-acetyltransferase [Segeticoccus sp.]|uniref:GNAT family N-acetyltransferase n=1 Tax=Segeticoccus sp. TaxID=2706531 RepID=UPI002D7EC957|nr:GNAT family N-acetyltransferase [Segeticoccus sp.]HET8599665.1 GNAT family N-acetyltransferase [Segeticoccus sp.]